ncbi:protein tolb [Phtheirospermum japonicum]|uniref:Protein tolb n=1 Tax=Phtheirospermum japonicum TaxID=374723 RepID=A0A830C155_9LAMI|nr:protein tolb [Phtheirospermum japonicum]
MIYFGPPVAFSAWLALFGYQIAVAAFSNDAANKKKDFISQLSDDILISIIARLQTKDAVRTSILSHRWRYLHKFVPDIELHCDRLFWPSPCPHDSNMVINEVDDRFLKPRSGSKNKIRSLNLTCCLMKLNANRFEQFIYSLGKSEIERLALNFSAKFNDGDFSFSCHLLSHMPTLTYLDLSSCFLYKNASSVLTQSSSLLQVIKFCGVNVLDSALECVLSNCLRLESLLMYDCSFPENVFVRGPNLQLKSLCIEGCKGINEIEFYATNLLTFEFQSLEMANFVFEHVPCLQSVFLDFVNGNTMSRVYENISRGLPNVKSLIFGTKGLYQGIGNLEFAWFKDLRQLSLHFYDTTTINLNLVVSLIFTCPVLQEFHLDTENVKYVNGREVHRLAFAVIHTGLKKVEITGHAGTKSEIEFARYILGLSSNLEQMQISRWPKWYEGRGKWVGRNKRPWSKLTLETIHKQLQGKAISKKARLIIQHRPIYEHTWTDV